MAENPGRDRQGVGGGVKLPRGINTPGVEELPRGDKTYGVTPEGDRVPGAEGRGRGGGRTSPTNRDTKASRDSSSGEEMAIGTGPAVPQRPQRGITEGRCIGAGGCHEAEKRGRERVASRRENPAGESSGVGIRERGPEASGVAENPGRDRQGVGGGVKLPRGINTPGVEELPRGDKTYGVTPEGDRVPGAEGRGRGGGRTSPTNRDTKASRDSSSGEEMAIGTGPAVPQRPQRGITEGRCIEVSMYRNPDGARPEHSALARRKYVLLAPEDPANNQAAA